MRSDCAAKTVFFTYFRNFGNSFRGIVRHVRRSVRKLSAARSKSAYFQEFGRFSRFCCLLQNLFSLHSFRGKIADVFHIFKRKYIQFSGCPRTVRIFISDLQAARIAPQSLHFSGFTHILYGIPLSNTRYCVFRELIRTLKLYPAPFSPDARPPPDGHFCALRA